MNEVIDWVNGTLPDTTSLNDRRILLLSGVAGTGKSSIANTIARHFDRIHRLGSSYCFSRSNQAMLRPNNLFSTISRDLADLEPQWKAALLKVVGGNRALRMTHGMQEQFEEFLVKPAKEVTSIGPVILVIDALDECGDSSTRKTLLSILTKRITELPSNFRVIITARPEEDIQRALLENSAVYSKLMEKIDESSTREDIRAYIQHEMEGVSKLEEAWPKKEWLKILVDRSEGLFQWASTACSFINGNGEGGLYPVRQMKRIISPVDTRTTKFGRLESLDKLYMAILTQVFPSEDEERTAEFQSVMGEIVAAYEPLSISALSALRLKGDSEPMDVVTGIVRPLGSVLSGVSSQSDPIRPLHTSFRDFLVDEKRSGPFYVDPQVSHLPLVNGCLQTMSSLLRFNICELSNSYLPNSSVPDLYNRVQEHVPAYLSYACRFWIDHLVQTTFSSDVSHRVHSFLETFTLFWLEVLALLNQVGLGEQSVKTLMVWNELEVSSLVITQLSFSYFPPRILTSENWHPISITSLACSIK